MVRKKRGSILIEIMFAIFILAICITVSLNSIIQQIKYTNREFENQKMNYTLKALCSEIKYNVPYQTVSSLLSEGNVSINYTNDFIEKMINTDITTVEFSKEEDKKILFEKLFENEEYIKIKIEIKDDDNKIEQDIIKARWMDEL